MLRTRKLQQRLSLNLPIRPYDAIAIMRVFKRLLSVLAAVLSHSLWLSKSKSFPKSSAQSIASTNVGRLFNILSLENKDNTTRQARRYLVKFYGLLLNSKKLGGNVASDAFEVWCYF